MSTPLHSLQPVAFDNEVAILQACTEPQYHVPVDPVGIPMFHTQLVVSPAVFQHVSEIFMQVRHWQICRWRPAWSKSALGIAKGIASNVSLALTAKLPAAENRLTWETNSRKPLFYRVKNQGGPWVSCDLSFIQFRDSFNAQAANFSY